LDNLIYKYFFCLIFTLSFGLSYGQKNIACFSADVTKGCTPFEVTFHDCSPGTAADKAFYKITGNGATFEYKTDSTYTLTSPGKYTVSQLVKQTSGVGTDDTTIIDYLEVFPVPKPDFNISYCEGRNIILTLVAPVYDQYEIDFGDGTLPVTTPKGNPVISHNYGDLNSRTITVSGKYSFPGSCVITSDLTITPLGTIPPPEVKFLSYTDNSLQLNFSGDERLFYKIQKKEINGTFSEIESGITGSLDIVRQYAPTSGNSLCYIVKSVDNCGAEKSTPEICSIESTVTGGDKKETINWKTTGNFNSYSVTRDHSEIFSTTLPPFEHTDNNINCGSVYCYTVTGNLSYSGKNTISRSREICVTGFSSEKPTGVNELYSTIESDEILLNWPLVQSTGNFEISRTVNNITTIIKPTLSGSYKESITSSNPGTCYKIKFINECGNSSDYSPQTCPVVLNIKRETGKDIFTWTAYYGSTTPLSYYLEKLDASGNIISSIPVTGQNNFQESNLEGGQFFYRIKITGNSKFISYSNQVEIKNEMTLEIPDAFTPNSDGSNDLFQIKGRFIKNISLTIWNRWGEIVFFSGENNSGWDGTKDGVPLSPDVYTYRIDATDFAGKASQAYGSVTLLK
jgi:gliding motility-associated-like protein